MSDNAENIVYCLMDGRDPKLSFMQAATPDETFEIDPSILAWFKARGAGWQNEINGVLGFYIDTVEHPASDPAPIPGGSL